MLDWFVLGRPVSAPKYLGIGNKLTARQWSVIRRFEDLVLDGNCPQFIDAADMGRSASKNQNHEECLEALCRAASMVHVFDNYGCGNISHPGSFEDEWFRCGCLVGRLGRANPCTARPIVASRITVPECPQFPTDLLDPVTRKKYLWPLQTGLDPENAELPPVVQLRASGDERLKLLKKLHGAGMLQPIPVGSYAIGYENGMFAVNKDRLVLDSRASNLLDPGQSIWSQAMASSTSLASIYLEPDAVILASGEDLKDYFYQFRVSDERIRKNVLCTRLSKSEAAAVFGRDFPDEECPVPIGLSTLAMGDVCAVEFAQCSHLALCLCHGVMKEQEVITLKGAIPRGLLHTGIIVDDLIVLEQMARTAFENLEPGTSIGSTRTARAREAYLKAGLPHNPKKGFVDEPMARFWGIELDGLKGILRASSLRFWPTCLITMRVCSLGLATVGLVEALAGSWVALLSIRRRLFSVMEIVFEPLGITDQKAVIRLSPELKDELLSFVILGRLAMVNLRTRASKFVVATDASTTAIAAVKAPLNEAMVKELSRHCLRKGAWAKLLQPQAALLREKNLLEVDDELPADVFLSNPLWDVIARSLTYTTTWKRMVRRPRHINILELQAFVKEEKRLCECNSGLRIPFGIDSQVCLGAVVKGRASSKPLNDILRQSMAFPLGADVYEFFMYFRSESNRADGPTRERDPSPPDLAMPPWIDAVGRGDFTLFDNWMMQNCRHFAKSTIPFDQISDVLDIKQNRLARASGRFRAIFAPVKKGGNAIGPETSASRVAAPQETDEHDGQTDPARPYPQPLPGDSNSSVAEVMPDLTHPVGDAVSCYPTILSSEAVNLLESLPRSQFFLPPGFNGFRTPGGLDLFSGRCGVAKQMISMGAPWVLCYDIERGPDQDLLNSSTRETTRRLL